MSRISLAALGGEKGKNLSHALDKVWLQNGVQGEGEIFVLEQRPNGRVALACTGGETGKYLSHAFDKLWLQDGVQGEGEEWLYHNLGGGKVALECLGGEKGKYLSHAFNKMWLQNGNQGEGEVWAQSNEHIACNGLKYSFENGDIYEISAQGGKTKVGYGAKSIDCVENTLQAIMPDGSTLKYNGSPNNWSPL